MGRPTKLDDLVAKRIVDAIAEGGSRTAAAGAARVHRATLFDWLARGKRGEQPFADFLDRVKKAESEAELAMVKVVRTAAKSGTWQAGAWWLERRRPRLYALRRGIERFDEVAGRAKDFGNLPPQALLAKALEQRSKLDALVRELTEEGVTELAGGESPAWPRVPAVASSNDNGASSARDEGEE